MSLDGSIICKCCISQAENTVTLTWWVASSKEHIKEVFRWNVWIKVSIVWAVSWRISPLLSTLVILSSFASITQNSVGIPNSCWKMRDYVIFEASQWIAKVTFCYVNKKFTFKCLCSTRSVILVWMEFQSKFSIWSFEFFLGGICLDPENFIEVFTLFYPV